MGELECPHCGDVAAYSDERGLFYDGQPLTCGCTGIVSADSESPAYAMTDGPDLENDPRYIGIAVNCAVCGLRKQPFGRSAPMSSAGGLCAGDECPGYMQEPKPGDLWPGERREDFGFPKWLAEKAREAREESDG